MWPWRDWVIKAFKENMPYDQFGTWQLAGDLLSDATKEQILATAFQRNHPMNAEAGSIDEEFRLKNVFDRTNTTSTAFLGLTMECAQCHDHKFDPISQKNYSSLKALSKVICSKQEEVNLDLDMIQFLFPRDTQKHLPKCLPKKKTTSVIGLLLQEKWPTF